VTPAVTSAPALQRRHPGFTLVEMLIVLALMAMLLSLALPRYFSGVARAKETVLLENLRTTRQAIDKFYGDQGRYPDSLDELVARKYLHKLPFDPVLESSRTWTLLPPEPPSRGNVAEIRSRAPGATHDGRAFNSL
jgi:general secretion pathway protein G